MACFLTTARLALLAALQADATLNAAIRTWFDWGPGLRKRYEIAPRNCPLLSVLPAELDADQFANVMARLPQDLEIGIAVDGPDVAPLEELVAAALDVIQAESRTCLSVALAEDGLTGIEILRVEWEAVPDKDTGRVVWLAIITARINWMRSTH